MIVCVSSKNPVKIEAARTGFSTVFPDSSIDIISVSAASEVPDQPMGSDETYLGASNRVKNAMAEEPEADFWIGIEGGNIRHETEMEAMAWVVIRSKDELGKARAAGFFLPPPVIRLINEGYELGHADEQVFGIKNSKQKMGSSGLLTNGIIDRLDLYIPAIVFALIPFMKRELFADKP